MLLANVSDGGTLGIPDEASEVNSAGPANAGGEAVAVEQLSSTQNTTAQFYIPGCTPVVNWPLYVVVSGDTLHKIATRHGVSWQNLAQANCLANPNLIYVGQGLHVPPTPAPPPDGIDGNLPVIANPPHPSPPGCNVFVTDMSQLVPVYAAPGTVFGPIAYLYNYARWLESNLDAYRIVFPFGGSGWVSKQVTHVSGDCGFELPEYNHPGPNPPLDSCNVVPSAGTGWIARIYTEPAGRGTVIGRLGNYAPVIRYAEGSFEIALPAWTTTGWVRETDIGLVGTCPDFYSPTPTPLPPSPTRTPVPPTPTHTATPKPPFSDLPHVSNPGRPAPEDCVVLGRNAMPVLIYPGPVSPGPIAVLDNYAPYVDSVDGGYVIALSSARRGWVAESGTQLEGQCFSTSSANAGSP
jgi:LysM repeat protein